MKDLVRLEFENPAVRRSHEGERAYVKMIYGDSLVTWDKSKNGRFIVRLMGCRNMLVIACAEGGWDHVSVSLPEAPTKTPSWTEMEAIKRLFFHPNETAMQLHPPEADYINRHPGVLHLWRPHAGSIPMPPKEFV